ncbi:hypothetical protein [Paenibacillus spongiae]|uniref:Uncharacterized protein n=1 Tax=Paenibacillus spongiae TaxID=2909671 RepID=A0ABY5SJH4_9BACL|nr:hypothetical protein [Paenibacillus spongiae]UVI32748.1 hypothetical protein L1F29_13365 [Paenibacillus spongiae]
MLSTLPHMNWDRIYAVLTDEMWSSAGAILGTIGVFLGAWLGAKFGYKQNVKLQNKQMLENKESYLSLIRSELSDNGHFLKVSTDLFDKKQNHLEDLKFVFEGLLLAAGHVKSDNLEAAIRANVIAMLPVELQGKLRGTYSSVSHVCFFMRMEAHKYNRDQNLSYKQSLENIKELIHACTELIDGCIQALDEQER